MAKETLFKQTGTLVIDFNGKNLRSIRAPIINTDAVRKIDLDTAITSIEDNLGSIVNDAYYNTIENEEAIDRIEDKLDSNDLVNANQDSKIFNLKVENAQQDIKIANNKQKDEQQDNRITALENAFETFTDDYGEVQDDTVHNLVSTLKSNVKGNITRQFKDLSVNEIIKEVDATIVEIKPGNVVDGEVGFEAEFRRGASDAVTVAIEVFDYITGNTVTFEDADGNVTLARIERPLEWPTGVNTYVTNFNFIKQIFNEGKRGIRMQTVNPGEEITVTNIIVPIINRATITIGGSDTVTSVDVIDSSTVGGINVKQSLDILNAGKVNGLATADGTGIVNDLSTDTLAVKTNKITVKDFENDLLTDAPTAVEAINAKLSSNIKIDSTSGTKTFFSVEDKPGDYVYANNIINQGDLSHLTWSVTDLTGTEPTTHHVFGIDGDTGNFQVWADVELMGSDTVLLSEALDSKVDKKLDISNTSNTITGFLDRTAEDSTETEAESFIVTEQVENIGGAGTLTEINRRFNIKVDGTFDYEVFGRRDGAVPPTPTKDWSMTPKKYVDDKVNETNSKLDEIYAQIEVD